MSEEQQHGTPVDAAYFASPDYNPDRFMASLVYAPETAGDLPGPPPLTEEDAVLVSRTYKLPVDVDTDLRSAAAAEHITVEELLRRWTRDHHAA